MTKQEQFESRLKALAAQTFKDGAFVVTTSYDPERDHLSGRVVRRASFWLQPHINIRRPDLPDAKIKESLSKLRRQCRAAEGAAHG